MKEYRRAEIFPHWSPTCIYITRLTCGLSDGSSARVGGKPITFAMQTTFSPAFNIATRPEGSCAHWEKGWHSFIWSWKQPRRDWWSLDGSPKNGPSSRERSRE